QDIPVFVPERLRRSMLVTPGKAKRPGACGTRRAAPTCKVELLGVRREGRGASVWLPPSRFASLGITVPTHPAMRRTRPLMLCKM
ncbi:MAG: hypothetical protein LBJ60_03280, partial [Tannerellaceae bacterium]|nr:hypothetical protein [Tannerellaceae bacterium]